VTGGGVPIGTRNSCLRPLHGAGIVIAILASGCGFLGQHDANQTCIEQAELSDEGQTVAGAFPTTVGRLREFLPGADPPPFENREADELAVLCYLDGPLGRAPPGGEPFNRAIVGVVGDEAVFLVAGYQHKLEVVP
jgi:hypothetical protein